MNTCPGSGGNPAELVIMDVDYTPPKGTCPVCKAWLTLDFYRMPTHDRREGK